MRPPLLSLACALLLALFACARPATAATIYATVELSEGAATIVDAAGKSRPAPVGETVFEGETLVTENGGELHLRTADHGLLALRANSYVKIDAYRAQADAQDTTVLSLVKGTFRSVTGWIGKYNRDAYRVRTSIATIGIRGTDHEPLFIPPGANTPGAPGAYDKVNSGGTYIESKGGRVNVDRNRAGFAPHDGSAPRVLEKIPEFFKPTRNEGRIAARKEQLEKEMEQVRLERQKAAQAEKEKAEKAAAAKEKADKEARDKADKETKDKSEKAEKSDKADAADKKTPRRRHPQEKK